jgi:hypothetical protein
MSRCVLGLGGRRALRHTTPRGDVNTWRVGRGHRQPRRANCARSSRRRCGAGSRYGRRYARARLSRRGRGGDSAPTGRRAGGRRRRGRQRCGHTDISRLGDGAGRGGRWRRLAQGRGDDRLARGIRCGRNRPCGSSSGGEPGRSLVEDCRASAGGNPRRNLTWGPWGRLPGRSGGCLTSLPGRDGLARYRHMRRRTRGAGCRGRGAGDHRRGTWHLAHRRHGRGCLLHTRRGPGAHALLQFSRTLRRASGPLAQALELARLREDEQRKDRDPAQRGEGRDRTDLRERVRKR